MKIRRKKAALTLATKDGEMTEEYMADLRERIDAAVAELERTCEKMRVHREMYPLPDVEPFDLAAHEEEMAKFAAEIPTMQEILEEMARYEEEAPSLQDVLDELNHLIEGAK